MDSVGWPQAAVALGALVVLGAVTVAAVLRYPVDEALQLWNAMTALIGVVAAFASWAFAKTTVQGARQDRDRAEAKAQEAEGKARTLADRAEEVRKAWSQVAPRLPRPAPGQPKAAGDALESALLEFDEVMERPQP